MLSWIEQENLYGARTHCSWLPKFLVSASESVPVPKHVCRSLNHALFYSEVDATNKNPLLTDVTNHKNNWICRKQCNSSVCSLRNLGLLWKQKECFADSSVFVLLMGRECDCSYVHIPVIMIALKSIKLRFELLTKKDLFPFLNLVGRNF